MTLCVDTEIAVKEAVDKAVHEVFRTMTGAIVEPVTGNYESDESQWSDAETPKLTVVLGFTGGIQGSLCLSLSEQAAIQWAETVLAEELAGVDQTVIDAVGELGNMVVGGAKRRLAGNNLTMSLPTVLRAGETALEFGTQINPLRMFYRYGEHCLVMTIALRRS